MMALDSYIKMFNLIKSGEVKNKLFAAAKALGVKPNVFHIIYDLASPFSKRKKDQIIQQQNALIELAARNDLNWLAALFFQMNERLDKIKQAKMEARENDTVVDKPDDEDFNEKAPLEEEKSLNEINQKDSEIQYLQIQIADVDAEINNLRQAMLDALTGNQKEHAQELNKFYNDLIQSVKGDTAIHNHLINAIAENDPHRDEKIQALEKDPMAALGSHHQHNDDVVIQLLKNCRFIKEEHDNSVNALEEQQAKLCSPEGVRVSNGKSVLLMSEKLMLSNIVPDMRLRAEKERAKAFTEEAPKIRQLLTDSNLEGPGKRDIKEWNLQQLNKKYAELAKEIKGLEEKINAGTLSSADASYDQATREFQQIDNRIKYIKNFFNTTDNDKIDSLIAATQKIADTIDVSSTKTIQEHTASTNEHAKAIATLNVKKEGLLEKMQQAVEEKAEVIQRLIAAPAQKVGIQQQAKTETHESSEQQNVPNIQSTVR